MCEVCSVQYTGIGEKGRKANGIKNTCIDFWNTIFSFAVIFFGTQNVERDRKENEDICGDSAFDFNDFDTISSSITAQT